MLNTTLQIIKSQYSQGVLSNSKHKLYYVCEDKEQINNTNYLFRKNGFTNELLPNQNIVFPLEVDCEYRSMGLECLVSDDPLYPTLNVTTQMKHPICGADQIFVHREITQMYLEEGYEVRHLELKAPFHSLLGGGHPRLPGGIALAEPDVI